VSEAPVDPALVELFNQAAAHAKGNQHAAARTAYETLFTLHAARGLSASERFLATSHLQLAYSHLDLHDIAAADRELAQVDRSVLGNERLYDFHFTRGNVYGALGQLQPMFSSFVEAISVAEELDDYETRPLACWRKILGVAYASSNWTFVREVALKAQQVAGVRGYSELATQAAVCLAEATKGLAGPDSDLALTVLDGVAAGQTLKFRTAVRIGSAPDCDLILPGCTAQASIAPDGTAYRLRATGEVFVSGVAATDATLSSFEKLVIGGVSVISNQRGGAYVKTSIIHASPSPAPAFARPSAVREIGPLLRARAYAGLALLDDDHVLIAGGSPPQRGAAFANAELFSLRDGTSRELPLAAGHSGPAVARLVDGRVLIAGGGTTAAEIYDPRAGTWTTVAPLRVQRTNAAAIALPNGLVVVLGGLYKAGELAAEVYDPAKNAWGGLRSPDFASADVARLDATRFLVAATTGGVAPRPPALYYVFDAATWSFTPVAAPNAARWSPSLCALDEGRVLVTGGYPTAQSKVVECFSAVTSTFDRFPDMLALRSTPAITRVASGRVLVIGGASLDQGVYSGEVFDPVAKTWSALPAIWRGLNPIGGLARSDGSAAIIAFGSVSVARETW